MAADQQTFSTSPFIQEHGEAGVSPTMLLSTVETLERTTLQAESVEDRHSYSIAMILSAYATCECCLREWAQSQAPFVLDSISGTSQSLLRTAEVVLPELGVALSDELIELANIKTILCTSGLRPPLARRGVSLYASALRGASVARLLYSQCFPKQLPAQEPDRDKMMRAGAP